MRTKLTAVAALAATAAMLTAVAAAGPVAARQAEVVASISPPLGALPRGAGSAQAFAFDARRPEIVYVATVSYSHGTTRGHVYKTTDGGRHWHATATRGSGWTGDVMSLAADPRHPGTLYAGTNVAVYKTVDGGRSWLPFNRGLFPPQKHKLCPTCTKVPFGTPGTPSWNRGNGWVTDLAVDPSASNIVYANAGGIRKSTDGGRSWKAVLWRKNIGLGAPVIASTRPQVIYVLGVVHGAGGCSSWSDPTPCDARLYTSADGGTTWRATAGFTVGNQGGYATAVGVDPQNPTTLYLAAGTTVLRSTDAGASWQSIADGLPAKRIVWSLAVDPQRSGTVYAGLSGDLIPGPGPVSELQHGARGVFKTTDGGVSWSRVSPQWRIYALAVDPARPTTIYAARWPHGVARSTDGGLTWVVAGAS
jgi:photosystem II stability/assembly factor-like uncharacterized protein